MSVFSGHVLDRNPHHTVAGLSLKGGAKDNFFFCLIQYFPDNKRWSLAHLTPMNDYPVAGNDTIKNWVKEHELKHLVLDFPLSSPPCLNCQLECPGSDRCPDPKVVKLRQIMAQALSRDCELHQKDPKEYERKRLESKKIDFFKSDFSCSFLSKSLKRRLKKGVIPYWHRSIDLWIWLEYYELFLELFQTSYDGLGGSSLMLMNRFSYLKRHFDQQLQLWESDPRLVLLELLRTQVVIKRYLRGLQSLGESHFSRKVIIKKIEKYFDLFIYDKDLELLEENTRAFESFLLAISGLSLQRKSLRAIPEWGRPHENFIIPQFFLNTIRVYGLRNFLKILFD